MPRSLITGGAGFVGSHLAEELLRRGEEVSLSMIFPPGRIDNIQHLKPDPKFHYVIDSVHNEPVLAELIDRCEVVYHLAGCRGSKANCGKSGKHNRDKRSWYGSRAQTRQ